MWDPRMGDSGPWRPRESPVEEILRKLGDRLRNKALGPLLFVGILAALWLLTTCVYKVDVEEVGVIQRFGKFHRIAQPGLNFKLPTGIEKVTKVPVRKVFTEDFGLRTLRPGVRTEYAPISKEQEREALMLTGDLNVVVVPWIVQYRIQDPYKYLFRVRNVRETLRDMSEAIVRQVVGDRSVNEVLNRREAIADEAREELQKALDAADTGIKVVNLELKTTNVPEPVQPAFNDVNKATQDKETMIRAAEEGYNREVPAAEGHAQKVIQEAQGYYVERVNRARGDANRFLALWQEYKAAPDITRQRLYLEAMSEVLPKVSRKIIMDDSHKGILPLLDLGEKGAGK